MLKYLPKTTKAPNVVSMATAANNTKPTTSNRNVLLRMGIVLAKISTALALFASCVPAPPDIVAPVTTFSFSADESLRAVVGDALQLINNVSGCELVELVEPGDFVTNVVSVEAHYNSDALGCAFFESALYPAEDAAEVIFDAVVTEMPASGASTLVVHELGHTLGLAHSEGFGFMYYAWREDGNFFDEDSVKYLRALCEVQNYWRND